MFVRAYKTLALVQAYDHIGHTSLRYVLASRLIATPYLWMLRVSDHYHIVPSVYCVHAVTMQGKQFVGYR